jgi:hypothetical protein
VAVSSSVSISSEYIGEVNPNYVAYIGNMADATAPSEMARKLTKLPIKKRQGFFWIDWSPLLR